MTAEARAPGDGLVQRVGRTTAQSQIEHSAGYFTLRTAIRVEDGEIEVSQRLADTPEGYAQGKARADIIADALGEPLVNNSVACVACKQPVVVTALNAIRCPTCTAFGEPLAAREAQPSAPGTAAEPIEEQLRALAAEIPAADWEKMAEAARETRSGAEAALVEDAIYTLARDMARRGLFVRDDFGAANITAVRELTTGVLAALAASRGPERSE